MTEKFAKPWTGFPVTGETGAIFRALMRPVDSIRADMMAISHARANSTLDVLCTGLLLVLALSGAPAASANARVPALQISESDADSVQIQLAGDWTDCGNGQEPMFDASLGIAKASQTLYSQRLNSEEQGSFYLKAARMGGGVYMHLPYFFPVAKCEGLEFVINARRILWGGKWHSGSVSIPLAIARDKSIFFTNEAGPPIFGSTYFDANIPRATRARLQASFARIIDFYNTGMGVQPMSGIGVVAALVNNDGNYSGYGGDALNIIRMSYDNPTATDLATLDSKFPSTFAHELAHKLQSERLFENPLGRTIVEGSADFVKVVALYNAGVVDENHARQLVRKAVADCANFMEDASTLRERFEHRKAGFREPYDCGMAYYFVAYYSSGLSASKFIDTLKSALSGEPYVDKHETLCLLFETSCKNERLKGISGTRPDYLAQASWLELQLSSRPLPQLLANE